MPLTLDWTGARPARCLGPETTINRTATGYAPWYVVPPDEPWYRSLCAARTIVDRMRPFRAEWERNRKYEIIRANQREASASR